jgi:hypothetical protein
MALDGLRDVLEVAKPHFLAGERKFFEQVIACLARNANSARFGYTLKPCGDVHAIAVNIVTVDDDVAEVYANPKFDPLIDTYPTVPLAHAALHFNGASYRIYHGIPPCSEAMNLQLARLAATASSSIQDHHQARQECEATHLGTELLALFPARHDRPFLDYGLARGPAMPTVFRQKRHQRDRQHAQRCACSDLAGAETIGAGYRQGTRLQNPAHAT